MEEAAITTTVTVAAISAIVIIDRTEAALCSLAGGTRDIIVEGELTLVLAFVGSSFSL